MTNKHTDSEKKIYQSYDLFYRHLFILIMAIIIDGIWGDPPALYKKIPHPIVWIGNLIKLLEQSLNDPQAPNDLTQKRGQIALNIIIGFPVLCTYGFKRLVLARLPPYQNIFLSGILTSIFIAQRSLYQHVEQVAIALEKQDLILARKAVSNIVGRKTDLLDEAGICRAAIESLAENFSDGVTAPIFWHFFAGVPGIVGYKAINTADSMIGHLTKRYRFFGKASAKMDDWVNIPASRLAALWILCAGKQPLLWKKVTKEARKHRSPNAGWPESAMALVLKIRLSGPRHYEEKSVYDPWIGTGRQELNVMDIRNALMIFRRACILQTMSLIGIFTILYHIKNKKSRHD